ncbi:MAG TPA: 2,4'-dihydroxyacetophenone dioxygenase family protein [Burkholderiales bacterium]|nr:2,4'-dihydroxyacetophenone dioxygenase family protein [Burkholderiales bacterium]
MNKPLTPSVTDPNRIPYQKSQPRDMRPDMVIHDVLGHSGQSDPRLWVPLTEHISVRPLQFNVTVGQYTHVMRVTKAGLIARHRHAGSVHAWVFKGRWHYLEHDWIAEEGSYIFEPPGETHTLVVPEGCSEMITLFQVTGSLMYVDPQGNSTGYDDVFTRLDKARAHYTAVGLGENFVTQLIR